MAKSGALDGRRLEMRAMCSLAGSWYEGEHEEKIKNRIETHRGTFG
jgi:hypothetical protein